MISEEQIVDFIKARGPVLPADISKEFSMDIFMASAMLTEIKNKGEIRSSSKRIGSSLLYYTPEQEGQVKNMLFNKLNDIEKRFVKMMREHQVAFEKEFGPQEKFLASKLGDFIKRIEIDGDAVWYFIGISQEEAMRIAMGMKREEIPPKVEEKEEIEVSREQEVGGEKDFEEMVEGFFENNNAKVIEKKGGAGKRTYVVEMDMPIAKQKFFVGMIDKSKVNESDLGILWIKGQKKKMPVIVLVSGKITKKALKFADKEFGSLMRVIEL